MPRFLVLWHIAKWQPVNMSFLHEKMFMANSTLTVIVDKLVEAELVNRHRNPEDRRVVLIELTKKGDKKLIKMLNLRQSFLEKSMVDLTEEDKKQFLDLLLPILDNLKEMLEEGDKKDE